MKKLVEHLSKNLSKVGTIGIALTSLALVAPSAAKASDIKFKAVWSGAYLGYDDVVATAFITFESGKLPTNGAIAAGAKAVGVGSLNVPKISSASINDPSYNANNPIGNYIKALTLTITDPIFGDETFGLSTFHGVIWDTNYATLDFTKELVGQQTIGGKWGESYRTNITDPTDVYSKSYLERGIAGGKYAGDFNIFDNPACVPTGFQPFTIRTCRGGAGGGLSLVLTSFKIVDPPRPVPVPGAVMGVVVAGGLLAVSKRKGKTKTDLPATESI
ncbi:MAG: hypothetical protein NW214_11925 [Pseudanabaenaceae cyanobacterium bins.39]|nr:hypothetical protein [Pseudanabaenaceae cyanobacterium bins.39]